MARTSSSEVEQIRARVMQFDSIGQTVVNGARESRKSASEPANSAGALEELVNKFKATLSPDSRG